MVQDINLGYKHLQLKKTTTTLPIAQPILPLCCINVLHKEKRYGSFNVTPPIYVMSGDIPKPAANGSRFYEGAGGGGRGN